MDPVDGFLLVIAAIFIVGIVGEIVFEKTGVPDVVWLILVGIIIGPVAGWVRRGDLIKIAPYFGALTLVIVLFNGGSQLRLNELGRAAPRASFLAILGFVLSAATLAAFSMGLAKIGWLPSGWGWLHGATLGAILGGSSSVVIMPALRTANLGEKISNLVNLESALTDVLCVVTTGACIEIMLTSSTDPAAIATTLGKSFGIGLGVGAVMGLLSLLVLRHLTKSTYAYPLTLGALLVLYVLIDGLKGSAALGILSAAVIMGNAPSLSHHVGLAEQAQIGDGVRTTHDTITFIVKSFFFTFIGAMLAPPWSLLALGIAFGLLLLIARLPAVYLSTVGAKMSQIERGLVAVSMPRGMAAGVLAMMPAAKGILMLPTGEGAATTDQLPVAVFSAVFTTIAIFAIGFPLLKRMVSKAGAQSAAAEGAEEDAVSEENAESDSEKDESDESGSEPVEEGGDAGETQLDGHPLGRAAGETATGETEEAEADATFSEVSDARATASPSAEGEG